MRARVEFRLSMPGVSSWDGKWSGTGRNYVVYRSLTPSDIERLHLPSSWRHAFGDGWAACVSARVMDCGERRSKTDGFCGYEWMIPRILRWGDTQCRCEWRPDQNHPGWERCSLCGTSQEIVTDGAAQGVTSAERSGLVAEG